MTAQTEHEFEYDERLERCPMCGSTDVRRFDRDHRGNTIDACRRCRVKFMNPQYSDADRQRFYSRYISFHEVPSSKNRITMHKWRWVREEGKRRSLELLGRYAPTGRLLCVGCGDGIELGIAAELGWSAAGYDVDPDVTAEVSRRYGVPMFSGDFAAIDAAAGSFDAVFMDQVIEHLKNPGEYLRKIRELLRAGGVLFLGMPNLSSWSNRMKTLVGRLGLRERRRGNHYGSKHHIFYYAPDVMRRLLERHYGFEVLCTRGSLKPQQKKLTPLLSRWIPNVDSGFIAIARKPAP